MKALEPILEQMVERRLKEQESGGALTAVRGASPVAGVRSPAAPKGTTPGTSIKVKRLSATPGRGLWRWVPVSPQHGHSRAE